MDNLQDLLAKRAPQEPPEIQIVKTYVREVFDELVNVAVQDREIIVTVGSASLAGALRSHAVTLLEKCHSPGKRLVLRIGRVAG